MRKKNSNYSVNEDLIFNDNVIGRKEHFDLIGILVYMMAFLFLEPYYILLKNQDATEILIEYVFFDIFAFLYCITFYVRNNSAEKRKIETTDYGNAILYAIVSIMAIIFYALMTSMFGSINLGVSGELNPVDLFFIEFGRIIPTEELFFRGFLVFATAWLLSKIAPDCKKSLHNGIIIIINTLMFGLMHIPKYILYYTLDSRSLYLIIGQLCILGALCCMICLKYGLFSSILLHTINNILANQSGSVSTIFETNLGELMIIGLLICVFILYGYFIFRYFAKGGK